MYNLGDDSELDGMSREAAGRYNSPGSPNWQALSEELDRVMPQEKKKRRFIFWWILPGLLAGGAATYTIIKQNDRSGIAIKNINPVEQTIAKEHHTGNNHSEKNTAPIVSSTAPTGATIQEPLVKEPTIHTSLFDAESSSRNGRVSTLNQTAKNKSTGKLNVPANPEVAPIAVPAMITSNKETEQNKAPLNFKTEDNKEVSISEAGTGKEKESVIDQSTNTTASPKTEATIVNPEPRAKEDNMTLPSSEKKTSVALNLPARGKGWSFSLLTGVDESTVKFKYGYKPGVNIGLIGGYHFNDTWAIKTGLIYTQKNYKMAGADFTAPKGTWVSYYKLDEVEGYCRMWEVPLLASYTLKNTGKKSVTLSTGLSSYFMTAESYNYYYYYNGNPTSRSANYPSTDTHILSIAHLSAGFENRISKTLSLQVEPYAKIPLGGVGFGSIRLSSFGVNFSVQWRQPSKK